MGLVDWTETSMYKSLSQFRAYQLFSLCLFLLQLCLQTPQPLTGIIQPLLQISYLSHTHTHSHNKDVIKTLRMTCSGDL